MFKRIKVIHSEYEKMTGNKRRFNALMYYFYSNNFRCQCFIREITNMRTGYLKHLKTQWLERKFGILIGDNTSIGENFIVCHFTGTVIGGEVKIGNNCHIYHQVTIGQKNGFYPTIGNNVILYPGCKVIGNIKIGNNVVIAPNAVVIEDIPDDSIAVGIPARIVSREHANERS